MDGLGVSSSLRAKATRRPARDPARRSVPDAVRLARLTGRELIALRGPGNDAPQVGTIDADSPQRTRGCALITDP